MRATLKFTLALAAAIALMLLIRAYAFTIYTVPNKSLEPQFAQGDRVVVNRLQHVRPAKREVVVFRNGDADFLGRVKARPGDTVRIDTALYRLPLRCLSRSCRCADCQLWLIECDGALRLVSRADIVGKAVRLFPPRR